MPPPRHVQDTEVTHDTAKTNTSPPFLRYYITGYMSDEGAEDRVNIQSDINVRMCIGWLTQ